MVNKLPPLAGPVDASGEPDLWKLANDYWERDTDADAKAFAETPVIWLMDFAKLVLAAASVPSPDITATLRTLAIYCFQKHGNDAYLYNALADLVGPEAMRGVPSSPAQEPPSVACPVCGIVVQQIASASLSLALWQHWNWVCDRRTVVPPSAPSPSAGAAQETTTETKTN